MRADRTDRRRRRGAAVVDYIILALLVGVAVAGTFLYFRQEATASLSGIFGEPPPSEEDVRGLAEERGLEYTPPEAPSPAEEPAESAEPAPEEPALE
jgi:hypothetical protein